MTPEQYQERLGALRAAGATEEELAAFAQEQEQGGRTLPPGLANPTVSDTWDMDELRRQALQRLLKRQEG